MKLPTIKALFISSLLWVNSIALADKESEINLLKSPRELNELSYRYIKESKLTLAYMAANKARFLSEQSGNKIELARALSNTASSLNYLGQYERALSIYRESLLVAQENQDLVGAGRAMNNIASIYNELGEYEAEFDYRIRNLNNALKSRDIKSQIVAYLGVSKVHLALESLESSKLNFTEVKERLSKNPDAFLNLFALHLESSILTKENKTIDSINILKLALEESRNRKFLSVEINTLYLLAKKYNKLMEFDQATEYAKHGLDLATKANLKIEAQKQRSILIDVYTKMSRFKQALFYSQQFQKQAESTTGERVRKLAEITKIDRQVAETEEALRQSKIDQEILSLELSKQQQQQYLWITGIIFLFGLAFFGFYYRSSKKEINRQKLLNDELVALDKLKDRVLSNTSHELRTPLNGIIGISEVMLQTPGNNISDDVRQSFEVIKNSGEQLALVVNDILDLAQIKSGRYKPQVSEVNLSQLTSEVIQVCQPLANKKQVAIKLEDNQNNTLIKSDAARIRQILFNLIGNAIKFTSEGYVQIQLDAIADEVNIVVSDTGIGIPEDKLERVFEGFEQVDSGDNRLEQGTGLGLAISRGLVQALGGSLTLHSVLGEGSQVVVNLPRYFEESI